MSSFNPTPNGGQEYITNAVLAFVFLFALFVFYAEAASDNALLVKNILLLLCALIFCLILWDKKRRSK